MSETAAAVTPPETRHAKFTRLLVKALTAGVPADQVEGTTKAIVAGEWGKSGAPYVFSTRPNGDQRLVITNPITGDAIGVVGKNRDELLAALDARLK